MTQFGCLIGSLLATAPRVLLLLAWGVADRWALVWDGSLLVPLLGIAFLPYTAIMYLLVWTPQGIVGFAYMWIALGVLLDVSQWSLVLTSVHTGRNLAQRSAPKARSALRRVLRAARATPWPVWLIFLLALAVRLVGVPYGLPQQLDPDEPIFVQGALRMVTEGNLDPGWYGAPASTLMDGMAGLYAAYGLVGILGGTFHSMADLLTAYQVDGSHFLLLGRTWTALTGTAVVVVAYALARELRVSVFWSALAAAVLALSPLMIDYSWLVRMDMLQSAFMMLVLLALLLAMRHPNLLVFVMAGVFLGLAAASKYPAIVTVIPIVAAAVALAARRRVTATTAFGYLVGSGVASLLAVLLVAPYLLVNFQTMLGDVEREARTTHLSHTGEGFLPDLWKYLTVALPQALRGPATLLGVAGVLSLLASRRGWLVGLCFGAYLLFISYLALWWVRWAVPLVPLAVIGAVFLLDRLECRLRLRSRPGWSIVARILVAGLLLIPVALPTASMVWTRATNDDPRVEGAEWIEANVPAGSRILIESYVPQVSAEDFQLLIARSGQLLRWQDFSDQRRPARFFGSLADGWQQGSPEDLVDLIETQDVDYVLLSGSWIRRYRAEQDTYAHQLALYETLLQRYPIVQRFGHDDVIVLDVKGG